MLKQGKKNKGRIKIMLLKIWLFICVLTFIFLVLGEIRFKINKNINVYAKEYKSGDGKFIVLMRIIILVVFPIVNLIYMIGFMYLFLADEDKVIEILKNQIREKKLKQLLK
jgi:uncharacterized membrane protein YidH (DUF202 family)